VHGCKNFDPFEIKISAADISALSKTTKAAKKWQNDAIRKKSAIVWHWAKFILVLL